jgi:alpha-L-rhamnosidase
MMNTVLADHGLHLLAYDFLLFEKFPGWLYAVNLGATTIWERWNSVLENGEISGTGMNSLNHYAYGSVVEFLFKHGAGIKAIEPGFRKVILEPKPDSRIGHINCKYDSASGQYVSNWKINDDGTISCHFEIPFGCSAIIKLPDSGRDSISVDPGKYDFTYKPTKKYLYPYDGDVRLELLVENKDALKIISQYLPQQIQIIEQGNIEELSKTLNDFKKHAEMLQQPVETFQEAISELRSVRL